MPGSRFVFSGNGLLGKTSVFQCRPVSTPSNSDRTIQHEAMGTEKVFDFRADTMVTLANIQVRQAPVLTS